MHTKTSLQLLWGIYPWYHHSNLPQTPIHLKQKRDLCRSFPSLRVLKTFREPLYQFTGEHPCRNAISIKLLCNFIEIALRHGCSPVNTNNTNCTSYNSMGALTSTMWKISPKWNAQPPLYLIKTRGAPSFS